MNLRQRANDKMNLSKIKQRPVQLRDVGKRDVRTQFGALCWRHHKDEYQVLLTTSRRRSRWIIPKGWPMDGATPAQAAETEAWEEAGVVGKASPICLGIFSYTKALGEDEHLPCVVAVFPVKVRKLSTDYPEADQRKRKWFSLKKAAALVDDPELGSILKTLDPRAL